MKPSLNMPLNEITATAAMMIADAKIAQLQAALKSVIAHWDEFGPHFGFEEILHNARKVADEP